MGMSLTRLRFRFSLRSLLLGMTMLCIVLAWFVTHLKWKHDRKVAREWIEESVTFCVGYTGRVVEAPWSLSLLGEQSTPTIWAVRKHWQPGDESRMGELSKLFPEAEISDIPAEMERIRDRAVFIRQVRDRDDLASFRGSRRMSADLVSISEKIGVWPDWCVIGEAPKCSVLLWRWLPEAVAKLDEANRLFPEAEVKLVSKEELVESLKIFWD
jgi:hypothetical protein